MVCWYFSLKDQQTTKPTDQQTNQTKTQNNENQHLLSSLSQSCYSLYFSSCSLTKKNPAGEKLIPQLCGKYVTPNSLYDTLEFTSWNEVELMPEFIPTSHYFITGDTLVVLPDKSFLMYKISSDRQRLYGLKGWAGEDTLKLERLDQSAKDCPSEYHPNKQEQHWLDLEKRYFHATLSGGFEGQKAIAPEFCEAGHAKSCINYAYFKFLSGETELPDSSLLIRAGDLGDYMGYFRLGEVLERTEQKERAKFYYQKSCGMGHAASCMAVDFLNFEKED